MNLKEIKRLVNLVEESEISHLCIEEDGVKVEIKKEMSNHNHTTSVVVPNQAVSSVPVAPPAVKEDTPPPAPEKADNLTDITAQMVGTFYAAPNPESAPYVKVGDRIKKGQVICIIEAMKLFNEIESEVDGVVEEICNDNATPVEFGQPLFRVRP